MNIKILKERIAELYDPDELVDILGVSTEELLEAFEDLVWAKRHLFPEVEDIEEDQFDD